MGGGYLVDGKIYRGMGGAHPEIGHQAINFRCAIFNFADNMLVAGALILMVVALRPEPQPPTEPAPAASPVASPS